MENYNTQVQVDNNNQPMLLKDWILTFLLLLIPIANIVLMFVWAFGSDVNRSKKTFFQAYLIVFAVMIVIYIIFGAMLLALIGSGSY